MQDRHFRHWPPGRPYTLTPLATSIYDNLAVTARRLPDRPALIYYDTAITYAELHDHVTKLAGYLVSEAGIGPDDRVLLYMQNAPQYVIGYYAILAANAVVIPVNPMNRAGEVRHMADDTGARAAIVGAELVDQVGPLVDPNRLSTIVVAHYADYIRTETDLDVPGDLATERIDARGGGLVDWREALDANHAAPTHARSPEDWSVIVYSSGTTGQPKGCLHTHGSVNAVIQAYANWNTVPPNATILGTLPLFHVTGMQNSMNTPLFTGATIIMMSRWNRDDAARLIERYRVAQWRSITTMMIDFLSAPGIDRADLSSLASVGGGGAQMPAAIARKLKDLTGLDYIEGYGLSETMAPSHINPPQAARPQCLGIPIFDVDSRVVDPETLEELGPDQVGEIVIAGPQVFKEYWRRPEETSAVFFERDGKRFFRSGDLGCFDADGYFYYADRLKRMINVSGYKVWPAEIEALLHGHPSIREACVIGAPDERRGETVKAYVVLRDGSARPDEAGLEAWCRENMAAYKVPRLYSFVDALPRSGAGKVMWRELQDKERESAKAGHD